MQTQVPDQRGVGAAPSAPVAVPKRRTMPRLRGFDYRRPYFYMVTLKRLPGLEPFSLITDDPNPPKDARGRPRYLIANDITRAFARAIRGFAARWRGLAPIETFIVMPDHLHLLLKLEDTGDQLPLGSYVHQLMRALAEEYWRAYGNLAILDLPVLVAVKGHRATKAGSQEWEAMVEACVRIGPGGAGVGTFMSPLEKECGNAIARAGGKWVVLSPEGFHARWHPPREKERFCAEGRMLFLTLYAPLDRLPTKAELYRRCHDMGDLAVAGLPAVECGATGRPAHNSDKSVVLPAPSGNAKTKTP